MIQLIPHSSIHPSPLNPRKRFDEGSLTELADSILSEGLLQNLVVRRAGAGHEIAAGERRWRAIKLLINRGDLPADHQVPVVVRDLTDLQLLQLATTENVARADMTPLEEAHAFARMLELGSDVPTIAAETGLSDRTVRTRLILAERLGESATRLLEAGSITLGTAQALTAVSVDAQERIIRGRTYPDGDVRLDAHEVRAHLRQSTIPVSRAKFPLERYQGEILPASIFDPDSEEAFADTEQFHALQREYAEELKAEAERQGMWAEIVSHYRSWLTPKVEDLNEAVRADFDFDQPGVIIELSTYTGQLEVHENVVKRKDAPRSAPGDATEPKAKDPLALTEKHRAEIQLIQSRAAQRQVITGPIATGLSLAIAALVTSGFYAVRLGHSRGLARDQLDPATQQALAAIDDALGLDPEIVYMSPRESHAHLERVLKTLAGIDTITQARYLAHITSSLLHFGVDGTWVDGELRDLTAATVMRHVDAEAALPTWRELGHEWLLLYPKARLEQIYTQATGQEPGALTRKNLAAGILDHARPGWLDQVPEELLIPDTPAATDEPDGEECAYCGDAGPVTDGMCAACQLEREEEEGELV